MKDEMTLRDYFAAKALEGWLASFDAGYPHARIAAELAYEIADAMLKVREAQP